MNKIKNNIHLLILPFAMLVCGLISVSLGKEVNWDMANYHFYNPYAFLSHRAGMDYWPSEFVHVHIAPTADFLTYFFISWFKPKTTMFAIGALHGINFWLLYLIARRLFGMQTVALLCAAVGMFGPTAFPGIGSFQHDHLVSLFVFLFMLFMQSGKKTSVTILSGLMLGVAVGIKLTAGIYVVGALGAMMLAGEGYRERGKTVMLVGFGVLAGVICTAGYWMLMSWHQYHNPVFPFFNNIFHSSQFPATNWADTRFMPHGWKEVLLFPFYFSMDGRTGDLPFRDFRFAIAYGLLALFGIRYVVATVTREKMAPLAPEMKWFCIFFVIAYVAWQFEFSIMRYAMALEMLAPVFIIILLQYLFQHQTVRLALGVVTFAVIVVAMRPVPAIRLPDYSGSYFNVKVPHLSQHPQHPHHAMVLMAFPAYALDVKPRPQTYLIPFLPQQWRYVGVPFADQKYHLPKKVIDLVSQFKGQFYVMVSSEFLPQMNLAAWQLGLRSGGVCGNITSDRQRVTHEDVLLCPFQKI